jgi:hypothetical protein
MILRKINIKSIVLLGLLESLLGCIVSAPLNSPNVAIEPGASVNESVDVKTSRRGLDCQYALLSIFPLNDSPSLNEALKDANLTLKDNFKDLQFTQTYLFAFFLSRQCIEVNTL